MTSDPFALFLQSIPIRGPKKPRKPKPVPGKYNLKQLYYDARRVMWHREYPASDYHGFYFDNKMPDVTTTNGTQRYICDVINNLGHHAERINTMGVPVTIKGKLTWRRSGSTKGSPDVHCIVNSKTWKIEVKNKDTLSKAQVKYQDKMQALGILHSVIYVGGLDEFWDEYYRIIKL